MAYQISRNIEASIIDYIVEQLDLGSWSNIVVEKSFARIYEQLVNTNSKKAGICVSVSDTLHNPAEIGSEATTRLPLILVNIYASNDGQRLDLKDYLVSKLKKGCVYYEYTVVDGEVDTKMANGRLRVLNLSDAPVNFNVEKSSLDPIDRYRHLIQFNISTGKIEE